jgi:surface antigen
MFAVLVFAGLGAVVAGVALLFMPKRMTKKAALLTIVGGVVLMGIGGSMMPESVRQQLEENDRKAAEKQQAGLEQKQQDFERVKQAIASALAVAGLPAPKTIEVTDSKRLVATFEIDDAAITQMAIAGVTSPKEFATKAVIIVRNTELPFDLVNDYRVTMNGPSPGPGLVHRYGSARFSEGSSVSWEPGLPR